jgi:hypothetical protein
LLSGGSPEDAELDPTMALQIDIAAAVALWECKAARVQKTAKTQE